MHENDIDAFPAGAAEELAGPAEAPVRNAQRIPSLDVLRGFALLGILMLNIESFAGHEALWNLPIGLVKPAFVGWHAPLDYALVTLKWLFAEGKMRGLFGMLFGAGAVLLTERIERRENGSRGAAAIFYRRNAWLLLFGACHGFLIWEGDILLHYAILALIFIFPLRRVAARKLIVLGLVLWIGGGTVGWMRLMDVRQILATDAQLTAAKSAGSSATPAQRALLADDAKQQTASAEAAVAAVHVPPTYLEWLPGNVGAELEFVRGIFSSLTFLEILGAIATGMGLYKTGFFSNKLARGRYVLVAVCGYAISWSLVLIGLWHTYRAGFSAAANARWMTIPYAAEIATGALANASIVLLLIRSGRLRWVFGPLAAVGRTAFTNYILTSLLCRTIFTWGPWKLYGQLEFYQWYLVALAVWTLNLLLSSLWLRVFAFGPLEWAWRSLTYWKRQPLLVRDLAA